MVDNPRFEVTLDATRRAYWRIEVAEEHHDQKVLEFVARSALMMRAARHEPEQYREAQRKAGIKPRKGQREGVVAIRVASGNGRLNQPHWGNAASYLCEPPPHDDSPPPTFEAALDYMKRRGGMKELSKLWSAHLNGKKGPEADIAEQIDALLEGLEPDFFADRPYPDMREEFSAGGYALALVRLDHVGRGYILQGSDKQLLSLAKRIRKRGVLKEGINDYIWRMRAKASGDEIEFRDAAD